MPNSPVPPSAERLVAAARALAAAADVDNHKFVEFFRAFAAAEAEGSLAQVGVVPAADGVDAMAKKDILLLRERHLFAFVSTAGRVSVALDETLLSDSQLVVALGRNLFRCISEYRRVQPLSGKKRSHVAGGGAAKAIIVGCAVPRLRD